MAAEPRSRARIWKTAVAAVLVLVVGLSFAAHVDTQVTAEDIEFGQRMLDEAGYHGGFAEGAASGADFDTQVRLIRAVQDAVIKAAPKEAGIALGKPREPKDLFAARLGLCFDRSRSIEKILSWLGFEVRHVAVYATTTTSVVGALLTPQAASHAVSEARTTKGWIVIDSNRRWIGLTPEKMPVSVAGLAERQAQRVWWADDMTETPSNTLTKPFVAIIGLYSRHGYFYPPYTPVPDVNVRQLLDNVFD